MMKLKNHTKITHLLLLFVLCTFNINALQAQEDELSETRSLDSFTELTATNGVNILLRKGSEEKAEIRISDGLLSDIITEVSGGELKIKMRPQINKELSVIVIVYYKSLKEITATKGATVETKTVMLTDRLKLNAKTGGIIKAEIECSDVEAKAFGSATVVLYGWAKRLEIIANTKSNVTAENVKADTALVRVATGAIAWVAPIEYLEAVANTGGVINYTNTPKKKNEKISSGGSIKDKTIKTVGNDLIRDIEE